MQARPSVSLEGLKRVGAFLAIYLVWGSTYLAIKVVVETIPPLTAAGIRFLIAGVAVFGWARLRGAPGPSRAEWGRICLIGTIMFVPTYSSLFWAERTVPSGLAAVLVATLPMSMLLFEGGVFRGQRLTAPLVVALAAGFVGVLLVTGLGGGTSIPWLPCVAVIVGEMFWAMGSVITKRVALPSSSMIVAGGEMICGGGLLLLLGGATGEWRTISHPPPSGAWVALGYLIVAGSIIAYSAYTWLLGRTGATRLSSFTYVNPVVALVIGYQFGGERLSAHAVVGSVLVLASVVLVLRATQGHDPDDGTAVATSPASRTEVFPRTRTQAASGG
jgi:drug/metabolite transporter (DMT)-like permease